jgi:ABC-2 type transport system permease protein
MIARVLRLGPRSPVFMAVIGAPLIITSTRLIGRTRRFAGRIGVVDRGRSEITSALGDTDGITLTLVDSAAELRKLVENRDLDAGLVLPEGFDAKVRAGEGPDLECYMCGETFTVKRIVLAATTILLVRRLEGRGPPVNVVLNTFGDEPAMEVQTLGLVGLTFFVFTAAAILVPALMLAEERHNGMLSAIIVTPARMSEVLVSRIVLGVLMAMAIPLLTLAVNAPSIPWSGALLATIAVAALMSTEMGVICGTVAKDVRAAIALATTAQILVLASMALQLHPNMPPWFYRLIPTHWFGAPLYAVVVNGASLDEVWPDLAAALGLAAVLAAIIVVLGRRMETKVAAE